MEFSASNTAMLVIPYGRVKNTVGVGVHTAYRLVNVDDHPDPMHELRRLMNLQMGVNHLAASCHP